MPRGKSGSAATAATCCNANAARRAGCHRLAADAAALSRPPGTTMSHPRPCRAALAARAAAAAATFVALRHGAGHLTAPACRPTHRRPTCRNACQPLRRLSAETALPAVSWQQRLMSQLERHYGGDLAGPRPPLAAARRLAACYAVAALRANIAARRASSRVRLVPARAPQARRRGVGAAQRESPANCGACHAAGRTRPLRRTACARRRAWTPAQRQPSN